jgi:hypothetical protein
MAGLRSCLSSGSILHYALSSPDQSYRWSAQRWTFAAKDFVRTGLVF